MNINELNGMDCVSPCVGKKSLELKVSILILEGVKGPWTELQKHLLQDLPGGPVLPLPFWCQKCKGIVCLPAHGQRQLTPSRMVSLSSSSDDLSLYCLFSLIEYFLN